MSAAPSEFIHVRAPAYRVRARRAESRVNVVWDAAAGYGSTVVLAGEWIVQTREGPVLAVDDRTFRRCYRHAGDRG